MSFKEYLNRFFGKTLDSEFYINEDDPFLFKESLNSSFDIIKKEKLKVHGNSVDLYYIDVNSKQYRIFIERDKTALHIGFERLIGNNWDVDVVTNDLRAKELLGIFGTIKQLLLSEDFTSVELFTENSKKAMLYRRILYKLRNELDLDLNFMTDDRFLILRSPEEARVKCKFKYKRK